MNNIYHAFSKGGAIICRAESDFISMNNTVAVTCCSSGVTVLAISIMSNHVHLLLEAVEDDLIKKALSLICKNYSLRYISKYKSELSGKIKFTVKKLANAISVYDEMLYVIKNPVHHCVSSTVFDYRFSSGAYIFAKELSYCIAGKRWGLLFRQCGQLDVRARRMLSRSQNVPENWLIDPEGMILPYSYIPLSRVRGIWRNNLKNFLYDMNKGTKEQDFEVIKEDLQDLSWVGLDDIQVCSIIDNYAKEMNLKSFHFFSDEDKKNIVNVLTRRNVGNAQIARCMWLTPKEVSEYIAAGR